MLEPGIWEATDGSLHFCAHTWCENHGVPTTNESLMVAQEVFAALCREKYPGVNIVESFDSYEQ